MGGTKQAIAFSDDVALSTGFQGLLTLRNAPPIQNILEAGANPKLFWDGRENVLASMVLKPIVNHVEMGMSIFKIFNKKWFLCIFNGTHIPIKVSIIFAYPHQ